MARVVVVGSINMDVVATTPHHPAVGETVLGTDLQFVPGGKGANQAVAAARLGAATAVVGRLGLDGFADDLLEFLVRQGVDVAGVRRTPGVPSGTALIVVDQDSANSIVVVAGANATLTVSDLEQVDFGVGDVVVAQCEIPLAVVRGALARAGSAGARTILNPSPALADGAELLALADVVVLNETELAFFTSAPPPATAEEAVELARRLYRRREQVVVATLGAAGAVALVAGEVVTVPGHRVDSVDSTGAGDCFVGALAAALCSRVALAESLRFANLAASLSVQRVGAGPGMPSLADVRAVERAVERATAGLPDQADRS